MVKKAKIYLYTHSLIENSPLLFACFYIPAKTQYIVLPINYLFIVKVFDQVAMTTTTISAGLGHCKLFKTGRFWESLSVNKCLRLLHLKLFIDFALINYYHPTFLPCVFAIHGTLLKLFLNGSFKVCKLWAKKFISIADGVN